MVTQTLYMAPLKGFTDHIFRTLFSEHFGGFDLAIAPFIVSKGDYRFKRKYVRDLLPENNTLLPVIPQILSKHAGDFCALANHLYDMGYGTVNWNLGCPYPMVTKKGRGCGMLPYTERIESFLDRVVALLQGRLSIKLRLGYHSKDDIFRLIPVLNRYPLEEIIIHPRTADQRYDGTVDLESFDLCRRAFTHPVVYNGDIKTVSDYIALASRFETIRRWMIGRWCLADPFLPMAIKNGAGNTARSIEKMKVFHEALFYAYKELLDGPSHLLNKMKGLWRYFSLPFTEFKKTMKTIKKSTSPDQYLERVNHFFASEARLRN